ncbi:unnamed protein product [Protopolystoma xenopodis]|uniref:Uncharacterized protein n=1 Tax=Protopolystoma xenopodis TaxID=117903 RepID=A0A448WS87_9PLAT|nr:unnamed protein product [Protopolystoma xenopodis]
MQRQRTPSRLRFNASARGPDKNVLLGDSSRNSPWKTSRRNSVRVQFTLQSSCRNSPGVDRQNASPCSIGPSKCAVVEAWLGPRTKPICRYDEYREMTLL